MKIFTSLVSFLTISITSRRLIFAKEFSMTNASISDNLLMEQVRDIVPKLSNDRHKGQAGRIGVVGGSKEYPGAPYFSAISALKLGADLVHVFCTSSAAPVIKSYSPDLIVHPLLDSDDAVSTIEPWLERLHVIVIGPGLGRETSILTTVSELVKLCRRLNKRLVFDADGLFLINQDISLIRDYPGTILTPNAAEFSRLFGDTVAEKMKELGEGVTVIKKGSKDQIYNSTNGTVLHECPAGGSGRRCGGQGDLMSGVIATFYHWSLEKKHPEAAFIASYAGSVLTKKCNEYAFLLKGRSMLASDMIEQIHQVFDDFFENKD
ncbi:ATP-dependent (S)-NAD(P)H-hydrate dehydratase [Pseudolycoriella hygida]|uniref:ATP-dependent (S)-NAD(P)H-hydrate dehydratase n=1 Tax=Pseudolycoriella hygida TaxID=35572 RepID=A0A9Q0MIP1_9DIPT|nr:ATP-dependent (S)-NAD(P)H-hydrate dehydratase [Pseudolycoriella hygida]